MSERCQKCGQRYYIFDQFTGAPIHACNLATATLAEMEAELRAINACADSDGNVEVPERVDLDDFWNGWLNMPAVSGSEDE